MASKKASPPAPAHGRSSPVETIHAALFSAILSQELRPGTKLNEAEVGAFFKVSRTVVREALTRLNAESVIDLRRNRGAFVASPSLEEAVDVFEARACVERLVVDRLARRVTPAQLSTLAEHNRREHHFAHDHDEAGAILLSGDFHIQIAQMAGNDVLTQFLKSLITRTSLILALYGDGRESDCSAEEHMTIVQALKKGDPARAVRAMTTHLDGMLERTRRGPRPGEEDDLSAILSRHV